MARSLWRTSLYKALRTIELTGSVLDLGGSHRSIYHEYFKGEPTFAVANLDDGQDKEYTFDFEKPFPIEDDEFQGIVCLNVLEHIFNYQNVISESYRILKPSGKIVLAVPFLIRYHPSPNDYWRYTEATLKRLLEEAGFKDVEVEPIGTGVFGAASALKHNVYRISFVQLLSRYVATFLDGLIQNVFPHSTYTKNYYPLGYVVIAKKQ